MLLRGRNAHGHPVAQEEEHVKTAGLLVKVRGGSARTAKALAKGFGAAQVTPILSIPGPAGGGRALGARAAGSAGSATWYRVQDPGAENPWDAAHALLAQRLQAPGFAASLGGRVEFVEPDIEQSWFGEPAAPGEALGLAAAACVFQPQEGKGGKAVSPVGNAWNLGPQFSQLSDARRHVDEDAMRRVRVAHLDTGYDPGHLTLPANLDFASQRNFRDPDRPGDATDRTPEGLAMFRNRGHGTATLALLAGNRLNGQAPSWPGFDDYLGGAPLVSVIPVRIADWVVRFSTGTMVQGFQHAVASGVQVLSMSMGGLSSKALADAVNLAYESGIFMVTAAGNNYAGLPSPKSIVFPARFRRVLAACGVMANGRAYGDLKAGTMQGNHGPPSKMETALGGFTPNVPWAEFGCGQVVSMDGAGTSAATPQIAAAAALWIARHWAALSRYPSPWMRVEAARHALFQSALKRTGAMDEHEVLEKIGRGIMQAASALQVQPLAPEAMAISPEAEPSWGWLALVLGRGGVSLSPGAAPRSAEMLSLELTQMAQRIPAVENALPDAEAGAAGALARNRYLEAALDAGMPSAPLKAFLERHLGRAQAAVPATPAAAPAPAPIKRRAKAPPAPARRLRVYALDPSIAQSLHSVEVNETVIPVPWEELSRGPVGEYVEVVDVDPASNRLYDPVDLDAPKLLAQDGWPP